MPKEEAGVAGYYLQSRVVGIAVASMSPLLVLSLLGVFQIFVAIPTEIRWTLIAATSMILIFRKRIEWFLERKVYSWRTGRDAEWAVRDALAEHLGDDFYLLNDVVIPGHGGNIDHIVIGPSGIHPIETKGDIGDVDAMNGRLRIRGYSKDDYIRTCKRRGKALRHYLEVALPGDSRTYPIHPVIVFTRASEVKSRGTTDGVSVQDVRSLLRLLDKYASRRVIDELHRAQVFHALRPHVASAGMSLIRKLSV